MKIAIEKIESMGQEQSAARIRHEVFEREWKCRVSSPISPDVRRAMHFLARVLPSGDPIATLSVVETSADAALHSRFEIAFPNYATVARYTQLAVLKPYRGQRVSVALMQEAQRRCAVYRFDYTWLLFNAARARSSILCTSLGFQASNKVFSSEFGSMHVLVREESALVPDFEQVPALLPTQSWISEPISGAA